MLRFRRLASFAVPILVLAILIYEVLHTPLYTDHELAVIRESAVDLAKIDQFDEALERLKALTEIVPQNPLVWGDYLTVMTWAGLDADAITLAKQQPNLPDYALSALFDAALREGDRASAEEFAQREIKQSKQMASVASARMGVLADYDAAQQAALTPEPAAPAVEPEPVSLPVAAAPSAVPAKPTGRRSGVARPLRERSTSTLSSASLQARHAPPQAAASGTATGEEALVDDGTAEREELERLADAVRKLVRDAEAAPVDKRRPLAEQALAGLDDYRDWIQRSRYANGVEWRNAELDRVRALTLAGRLPEAETLFRSLGDPAELPVYGLLNGADVYALRQRPEQATPLLEAAYRQAPTDPTVLSARFYNQLDREDYDAAAKTLAELRAATEGALWVHRLSAMFEAYQNHLDRAQARLEALRPQAPHDPALALNLATIYRWRGWPTRALDEYRKAEADGADPLAVRAGVAQALFDQRRFREAGAAIAELGVVAPNNPDTVALQAQWDWFKRYQYIAQVQSGQSNGSPVTGSSDLSIDQWLYSPISDEFRAFIHHHYDWADFIEGAGGVNRIGIGIDYRSQPFDVAVAVTDRSPTARKGLVVSGEYRPDESWTLFGDIQTDTNQVPLRGSLAGVDGHSVSGGVLYRWDERRNARLSYTRADFDDGNKRDMVGISGTQTLWTDAKRTLAVSAELYFSHSTAGDDVAYYDPQSDRSLYLSTDYTSVLMRRGDRSWVQRINIGAGVYEQQDFSNRGIWHAQYEQRWNFTPLFSLNYGLLYRSRVYSDDREGYGAVFGGVNWRF